ncbi:MAG: B12-binding domain-containing radical SAM protein, partial [Candidatus Contendobacter sp.]|nr:B12-binding domain-containing radical SAM protein [Candidatus Contendobacter sp.]
MPAILLSTLNARYFHASLGLRYLYANLGELQADAVLREFIITQRPLDVAEAVLAEQPRLIGFGVYIWNV